MKKLNYYKGRLGEDIAKTYLEDKGYELIEANHRNYLGEIDLVFKKPKIDQNILVFVEVKLKIGDDFGQPEEMLTTSKLKRVERIAVAFLKINQKTYGQYQTKIEAVCIVLNPDKTIKRITHYEQL